MSGSPAKLLLLFVTCVLLLNAPVLAIFNRAATFGGVPVLFGYLFTVWTLGIVAVVFLTRDEDDG